MNRPLWLLALCQGLFLTNNVTFIAINGLVGWALAPLGWMATLPVMGYVVGGALATGLVARSQRLWGRQRAFMLGAAVAVAAALLCAWAVATKNFWLLCAATVIAGYYNANAGLYRFAAAELAGPSGRDRAVSLVMAGGLLGAVAGPNLAAFGRDLMSVPFAAAYLLLAAVAALALVVLAFVPFPEPASQPSANDANAQPLTNRSLWHIARQPVFAVAAITGALSYGVMNLLMAATPMAMQQCGLPFSDAAFVLEWHVIGMFAPGFFTGHLIQRWGALWVMGLGVLLYAACMGVALSGLGLQEFWLALLLLGVGWNFVFTGSTTLSLGSYAPQERDRAQGLLNFSVFATLAVSSLASGVLVTTRGWEMLQLGSLPAVLLMGLAVVGLGWWRGRQAKASASMA
jgi:MFS family permease